MRESLLLSLFLAISVLSITGCSVTSPVDTVAKDTETQPVQTTATTSKTTIQTYETQIAANIEPAVFSVSNLIIEPREVATDSFFSISVIVTNTGGSQGSYDVVLYIDDVSITSTATKVVSVEIFTKSIIVAAGDSSEVIFDSLILSEGFYTAAIGGLKDYLEVGC